MPPALPTLGPSAVTLAPPAPMVMAYFAPGLTDTFFTVLVYPPAPPPEPPLLPSGEAFPEDPPPTQKISILLTPAGTVHVVLDLKVYNALLVAADAVWDVACTHSAFSFMAYENALK